LTLRKLEHIFVVTIIEFAVLEQKKINWNRLQIFTSELEQVILVTKVQCVELKRLSGPFVRNGKQMSSNNNQYLNVLSEALKIGQRNSAKHPNL